MPSPANESATSDLTPPPGVQETYERMARAIGEFEKSRVFNRFTSKYDYVMAGMTEFTEQERTGLELFNNDKSQCSACHSSEPIKAPGGGFLPPLFTDFSYDNLGLPRNVNIAGNPEPDPGLGGRSDIAARDPNGEELGKHKVMGLRNIALTAPYMHNGSLATLKDSRCISTIRATPSPGSAATSTTPASAVSAGRLRRLRRTSMTKSWVISA